MGWGWVAALAVLAGGLAWTDLRTRRLPNVLVVLFAATVASMLVVSAPPAGSAGRLVAVGAGLTALAVAVAVYGAGLMAAGDAKILGPLVALQAWLGPGPQLVWLGCAIVGAAAALAWLVRRPAQVRALGVPLGTVLLIGVAPSLVVGGPSGWL